MPIYEYQCQACGSVTEKLQKMSDAPLKDCPSCGEPQLEKLVSAAGFQLKGSGWYVTDFRNKGGSGEGQSTTKKDGAESSGSPCASGTCPAASH